MTHAGDDARLSNLQAKWSRHWKIWRATNYMGQPGDWVASRIDPAAGPDRTVMRDTADDLNDALHDQAAKAARGVQPVTISPAAPE